MTQTDIYREQSCERDMDEMIGELLKQGDPDNKHTNINVHTQIGKLRN